ncbi:MAG: hypothetical protein NC090_06775 [Anaeroplasma bactoclasticum]|nr:hypothetical protein [Anaeroplasma bactoclasticum]
MSTININATINKVRDYLTKDLEKYQVISASYGTVNGINYENIKVVASMNPSATTDRILTLMNYQAWTRCTLDAISNCIDQPKKPYKTILQMKYIEGAPRWQVANKIGYSDRYTDKLRDQALLNFADVFLIEQIKQGVHDILDLHIYKTEKEGQPTK